MGGMSARLAVMAAASLCEYLPYLPGWTCDGIRVVGEQWDIEMEVSVEGNAGAWEICKNALHDCRRQQRSHCYFTALEGGLTGAMELLSACVFAGSEGDDSRGEEAGAQGQPCHPQDHPNQVLPAVGVLCR